jgi:hypothetical protein
MEKAYNKYLIDLSDLWRFEIEKFYNKQDRSSYEKIYKFLIPIYLYNAAVSFIDAACVKGMEGAEEYYNNYKKRLAIANDHPIEFFESNGAFYDMNQSVIINRGQTSNEEFNILFSLKMEEYCYTLENNIYDFITYHFFNTGQTLIGPYILFLQSLLNDNSDILNKNRAAEIKIWILEMEDFIFKDKKYRESFNTFFYQTNESSDEYIEISEEGLEEEEDFDEKEAGTETLSKKVELEIEKHKTIPGKFTQEEIHHYFSFLYNFKMEIDGSYLKKEEVEEIFKHGFAIPKEPIKEKYKLNITPRLTRKAFDAMIYNFFFHHNSKAKKDIVMFLASYLKDYERALNSEMELQNILKNIRRDRPSGFNIKIGDFLPERFQPL